MDAAIDRTYVSRLERNLENPTVAVLERLSKALGCHIADLFVPSGGGKLTNLTPGRKKSRNGHRVS